MPPHGVHPQQAAKELKAVKVTSPLHQHLQAVAKTAPNYPGMGTKGTGVPSPSVSAIPKGYKPGKKIGLGPQPVLGYKPKHIQRQQAQLGKVKKGIAKENASYAAMVNPLSHQNLTFAAEGLTGYHEIAHLRNHPIAGGLAIAGLLPFGRAGHILEEAHALGEGAQAAKVAEKGSRVAEFRAARRALKIARRGPARTDVQATEHVLSTAKKARQQGFGRIIPKKPEVVPGATSAETGGEAGKIIRQGLRPDLKGLGKYEKVGAKLDNPGINALRKQQEEVRAVERSARAGAIERASEGKSGLARHIAAKAELEGKLPAKVFRGFDQLAGKKITEHDSLLRAMGADSLRHGGSLRPGETELQVVHEPGKPPMVHEVTKNRFGNFEEIPGTRRAPKYLYRAISEEDYQQALKRGYLKSDGRMNLAANEGTVAGLSDPSFYLPGKLASSPHGEHLGRIVRIEYHPGDGWKLGTDGYVKTQQKIPMSRVDIAPQFKVTKGTVPSSITGNPIEHISTEPTGIGHDLHSESAFLNQAINHIYEHPHFQPYEKVRAVDALHEALAGKVPTKSDQKLLERAFGIEKEGGLRAAMRNGGLKDKIINALNVPRSLMASFDLSAPFRQGLVVAAHSPKLFTSEFGRMFKAATSEDAFQGIMQDIHERPTFPLMEKAKLGLTDIGETAKASGSENLSKREEQFISNYAEQIPGIGKIVRGSDRAYVGFLNKTRADLFDSLLHQAAGQGYHLNDKLVSDIAKFVNSATGRGDMSRLADHTATMNAFFFSPRLLKSRLDFLNPAYYMRMEPFARRQALKAAYRLLGTLSTVLVASKLAGATVVTDPRNADFAKIRFGDIRIDPAGGFTQPIRLLAELSPGFMGGGQIISSVTGKRESLSGAFGHSSRLSILENFAQNKLAPVPGFAAQALQGQQFGGGGLDWSPSPADPNSLITSHYLPLLMQDIEGLHQQTKNPAALGGLGLADLFGVGVQSYAAKKKKAGNKSPFGGGSKTGNPFGSSGSTSSNPFG